ncbi:DUF4910 domain-containing protein [Hymenobacter psychrotolerans]|uniref:Aminopeptidase-like domain-containing protein n=1 Tax=Hymenobacter psychrotolerans DSM 18569 TaxID=1121959 RepID=A0A1M6W4B9_9BACT|nr:DUF4910 domain-containing protein [Hymenobacter psychrotolerans]SHK88553.1 aminopeptidase-like domain-containing protein [Hymenobacter psychrotolerans DSM 18569]
MPHLTTPEAPAALSASLQTGAQLHALLERLFPICRSITGDGVRQTLAVVQEYLPDLQVHEVPSGTPVLDWTVPAEWNIRDAWVKNAAGERVIDFQQHSLHVLGYSTPVRGWFSRQELEQHLFSLPEQPTLIPYRTSYYQPGWGFCLSHEARLALSDEYYEVCIDSTLDEHGSLTYGELVLPATVAREEAAGEVLLSCHCCHPSLANDNLSGLVVAVALAGYLARQPRRYAYRFVFGPGTIGSITWLARNPEAVARIRHGLVLTLLGGPGDFTYKQSRRGTAATDQAVALALRDRAAAHHIRPWLPYGYDERQYCSPGFNLPVGCLSRTPFGEFAEYHTSADNPSFVRPGQLQQALELVQQICRVFEHNRTYRNLRPYGEPQLGRRGLYKGVGGGSEGQQWQMALLWVLSLSDGEHSLPAVAEQSGLPFELLHRAAQSLAATDLLEPV